MKPYVTADPRLRGFPIEWFKVIGIFISLLGTSTPMLSQELRSELSGARSRFQSYCPNSPSDLPLRLPLHHPGSSICNQERTILLVLARSHFLAVCENGKLIADYDVAVGYGGLHKHTEGDHRTPVGIFYLGAPEWSPTYFMRMRIHYPNAWMQQHGWVNPQTGMTEEYTGTDLFVHGPTSERRCLGAKGVAKNWTEGCIALASQADILALAEFVQSKKGAGLQLKILDK